MLDDIRNIIRTKAVKRLKVWNGFAGAFPLDDALDCLATLVGLGEINGYDGEEAIDSGNGFITIS
jgi:hypothetical protein